MTAQIGREDGGDAYNRFSQAPKQRRTFAIRTGTRLAVVAILSLWSAFAVAASPHVVLLRGWFGVFSTGLDSIADQLKAQGIDVEVAGHLYWSTALTEILRERSTGQTRLLVLVGHSQGANNVINMARALQSHGIRVDLLVTISPFLQNSIPANVVKAINYYQAPGWGQAVEGDRGFHGKIMNVNLVADLTVTHISIDKNQKVQAEIVHEIAALAQQAGDQKPTAVSR
jgi:pimeloyl-ACP methyl ester carboxylesterase